MFRVLFSIMAFSMMGGTASAQKQYDKNAIKNVIIEMFDGMRDSDVAKVAEAFWPDALLTTATEVRQTDSLRSVPAALFAKSIGGTVSGELDERITWSKILVDGNMAMAWTPYRFFFKGKASHSGVNLFVLTRREGHWKIQSVMDTRHKQ